MLLTRKAKAPIRVAIFLATGLRASESSLKGFLHWYSDLGGKLYFLLFALAAMAVALAMAPIVRRLGEKLNAVDFGRHMAHYDEPVPRTGGILILSTAAITLLLAFFSLPEYFSQPHLSPQKIKAIVVGIALILMLGLVDDVYGLRARWKLAGQVIVAVVSWWLGLRIEVITNVFAPDVPIELGIWSLPIFVCWTVLCVNAMNIIDGIDCLAGGVAALGIVFFMINCLLNGFSTLALASGVFLGALAVFLVLNHRKKLYLGDSGSMMLGFVLASLVPLSAPKSIGLASVLISLGVLSIPIAEVLITTLRRILYGKPVGEADQEHIHYRLVDLGLSIKLTAIMINGICFLGGLIALTMSMYFNPKMALLLVCCWIVLVIGVLGLSYMRFDWQNNSNLETRNTLFLDHERIIQRYIGTLYKAANAEEAAKQLHRIVDLIGLEYIHLIFHDRAGELLLKADSSNIKKSSMEGKALFVMEMESDDGISCTIKAKIDVSNQNLNLNQLSYWIYQIWSSLKNNNVLLVNLPYKRYGLLVSKM